MERRLEASASGESPAAGCRSRPRYLEQLLGGFDSLSFFLSLSSALLLLRANEKGGEEEKEERGERSWDLEEKWSS